MHSTHGHGIDILISRGLGHPRVKFTEYSPAVGGVIPLSVTLTAPLRGGKIVEEHRFAMRSCDYDAVIVHRLLALRMRVERTRAVMHGRSEHIAAQTQQQFTHACISERTYVTELFFIISSGPGMQPPVFVIDKDAAIFHRRGLRHTVGPDT